MLNKAAVPVSLVLALAGVFLSGCGGGDIAAELRMRPRPQSLPGPESPGLKLPADQTFSIALSSSQQSPGLGGKASAAADADRAGKASARAVITGSGEAWGEFQLGHELRNDGDQAVVMQIRTDFHYLARLGVEPEELRLSDGKLYLRLYVRDARGAIRRTDELLAETTEDGDFDASGQSTLRFAVEVAPGQVFDVFLAGRVEVSLSNQQAAVGDSSPRLEAALELSDVAMEVVTRKLGGK